MASDQAQVERAAGSAAAIPAPPSDHLLRTALDLIPLVVFFVANLTIGIYWATGLCMVATVACLVAGKLYLNRVSVMAVVTCGLVLIFGGLTVWLQDPWFIKIKPTVVNLLFASALLGGLAFNQLFVRSLLGEAMQLMDEGWRKLQFRWGLFFILLAAINEVARAVLSTEAWAGSKFLSIPLTFAFMISQIGLFKQYAVESADTAVKD